MYCAKISRGECLYEHRAEISDQGVMKSCGCSA
jgi:hypothetical protein